MKREVHILLLSYSTTYKLADLLQIAVIDATPAEGTDDVSTGAVIIDATPTTGTGTGTDDVSTGRPQPLSNILASWHSDST